MSSLPCTKSTGQPGPANGTGSTWRPASTTAARSRSSRLPLSIPMVVIPPAGVPGRGDPVRIQAARSESPALRPGQDLGEHVRGVGRLVDQVEHVEVGDPVRGVRKGRCRDHEAGAGPAL